MILKEKIAKDYIDAFKSKNVVVKNLLSVIRGEIQTLEKNKGVNDLSDDEVVKIIKKSVKSLRETISSLKDSDKIDISNMELSILESYLPKQLSIEEIQNKIDLLVGSGIKNIGQIMKEFSNLPVDKKIVSELAKKSIV